MDATEEEEAAAALCAACRHEPGPHGVCVYCGALKGDPGKGYEPPIRRPRHRTPHEMLDMLAARWVAETGKGPSSITLMEFMVWSAQHAFGTGVIAQMLAGFLPRILKGELERMERSFSNQNYRAKKRRVERVLPLLFEYRDIMTERGIASTGIAFSVIVDVLDGDVQRARENVFDLTFADAGDDYRQIRERFATFVALARAACDSADAGDNAEEVQS